MIPMLAVMSLAVSPLDGDPGQRLTDPSRLPAVSTLPDPFLMSDGARLRSRSQWRAQRKRLLEMVLNCEYGGLPPRGAKARAEVLSSVSVGGGLGVCRDVRLHVGPRGAVVVSASLAVPPGPGPFPVVVDGDLGWGRVDAALTEAVLRRGYALAMFNREDVAPDNATRGGIYSAFPQYDGGRLAAWAWGYHRFIDYLIALPEIDPKRVIVTGHSRGGKAALLAGATDERIALTAPNNSGCGGAGCYRVEGPDCEHLKRIVTVFPYWFHPRFAGFADREQHLPFDQHTVKALVAPRGLLSTEALGDLWANPLGSQVSYQAAREVWAFLGVPERIGIRFRDGGHEHSAADWMTLLDFADAQFGRTLAGAASGTLPFGGRGDAWPWRAPQP